MEQRKLRNSPQEPSRLHPYRSYSPGTASSLTEYSWEKLAPQQQRDVLSLVEHITRQRRNRRVLVLVALLIVLVALGGWYMGDSYHWFG